MKIQEKHIAKPFLCGLIIFSLLGHLAIPFSSQAKKAAFTNWLSHNVITSDSRSEQDLRDTILDLPSHSQNFEILVRQASELIANHKENFRFNLGIPFNDGADQRMSTLLIDQWSVFNSHKTGQVAVIPDLFQSVNKLLPSKTMFPATSGFASEALLRPRLSLNVSGQYDPPAAAVVPLISGYSINSP
jgi:hypothetical protein